MIFRILHYLPETMSLYGDYANASALARLIDFEGGHVELIRSETFPDNRFDAVFIGSGTERNSFYMLDALAENRDALMEQTASGILFATGNSWEMFGKTVSDSVLGTRQGLGFFDFEVTRDRSVRVVTDVLADYSPTGERSAGFINGCSLTCETGSPMFRNCVCSGFKIKNDGIISRGFYGTSFSGPVLIRNPHVLRNVADALYNIKGFTPERRFSDETQSAALSVTLSELEKRLKKTKK
ncbi:MAG: hypothetical protein J5563_01355 [Clostridia bacterium]|nr:hypothetical protein [Clostridia bacterium]